MIYRLLADLILVLHLLFVLFAIFGGLLVLYRRFIVWFHLPALVWAIFIEFFQMTCPLTTLENYFRGLGGEAGYSGGFIEHYAYAALYWQMSMQTQFLLGISLIGFNVFVYFLVFRKARAFSRVQ